MTARPEPQRMIAETRDFVREIHAGDTSGHDWWHVARVCRLSDQLAASEGADRFVTSLIALLHDVDDPKLEGDGGLLKARRWFERREVDRRVSEQVLTGISQISFSANGTSTPDSLEAQVVQDADRIDALGAIGVARAFAYGGFMGQPMHDPSLWTSFADRSSHGRDTTSHIREKLLVLAQGMNTEAGRTLAAERAAYVREFLRRFLAEWAVAPVQEDGVDV